MNKEKKETVKQIIFGSIVMLSSFILIFIGNRNYYTLINKDKMWILYISLGISFLYLLFVVIFNVILKKYNSKIADILSYINIVPLSILVVLILNCFFFNVTVKGSSMENTLYENDVLIVSRISKIEIEDIVIIKLDEKEDGIVKRVIAKEGDTFRIEHENNKYLIYVNDELIKESYIGPDSNSKLTVGNSYTLKSGEYFCLGDNINNSFDSRHYGIISESNIVGEVIFKLK